MENYMGMEIDMLNEKLKEKDERIKELEGMIVGYRNKAEELEILQNDNNKLCEHIEELNRNLDSANRENDELRRELNKKANRLHDEIANKNNRIEALVKENDILSKTVGELERERRVIVPCKLIDELQAAKEKVEELEKQIKEKDECIRKKANNIERLDRALEIYCNRVHELSVGNDNLRKDNKELVERIEKLEQEKERTVVPSKLIDELQAASEKVEELEKQIKERDEWIENLKEENEALKRKADGWKENAKRSVATIDYMRDKNDKIEKYVDKLNCDIAQKDEQIEKLNKELAIARVGSQTRMSWEYTISRDEALKAINEAIKKLNEEN